MKLLVVTQAVDRNDTTLGFFHRWIEEFSKQVEKVEVICLREGEYSLPKNVNVFSLGKEKTEIRTGKFRYVLRFCRVIIQKRNDYDVVFVHMNQEYLLLGGLLWKLWDKKIFFWRNHPHGNGLTKVAVRLADRVFYTSQASFTARFEKAEMMPAGIDTKIFNTFGLAASVLPPSTVGRKHEERKKNSLLMFGRIAPIKKIEFAIDALAQLQAKGVQATVTVVGDALPKDLGYLESLKDRAEIAGVSDSVFFEKGVAFIDAPTIYNRHEICLNFTPSGSFDKTVLEALACGTKVLVSNDSMKNIVPDGSVTSGGVSDIVLKIEQLLSLDEQQSVEYDRRARETVRAQSLGTLVDKLIRQFLNK